MTAQKKHETHSASSGQIKPEEPKKEEKSTLNDAGIKEEILASDVIIKTTGTVEVIEEIDSREDKSEKKKSEESASPADPLTEFKQRMNKEELDLPFASEKKNYMWPILFIFILAIALLAGIFIYKQGIFKKEKVDVASVTPTPAVTAEPTKAVDLTKYEIEIQNGSEVSGEASRQKTNLEEEGFKISTIGNADNSDYTDTIIKAKKEVDENFITKLKDFLNNAFTVGETETLPEDSSASIVVIIGTKK